MSGEASENPEAWAGRPDRGDGLEPRGTSGALSVTSGRHLPGRAWLAVIAVVILNVFVNVTTVQDDARRHGIPLPLSRSLTLEISSALAALVASVAILWIVRVAPPGRGPLWRTIGVHLGGTLVYSSLHVALMTLLRSLAFAAAGQAYVWSWSEAPYEYRKDVLSYVVIGGIFWVLTRGREPAPAPASPATFDIRDGAAILRVTVHEILAAQAAGNYVEFLLEDGRRPLMRGSLAQAEAALAPRGFLRTHRSWLVNAARVRALSPAGSGDFRLDLGGEVTAPLSRRYPQALARLRGEGS
jgi:hypothetical protein